MQFPISCWILLVVHWWCTAHGDPNPTDESSRSSNQPEDQIAEDSFSGLFFFDPPKGPSQKWKDQQRSLRHNRRKIQPDHSWPYSPRDDATAPIRGPEFEKLGFENPYFNNNKELINKPYYNPFGSSVIHHAVDESSIHNKYPPLQQPLYESDQYNPSNIYVETGQNKEADRPYSVVNNSERDEILYDINSRPEPPAKPTFAKKHEINNPTRNYPPGEPPTRLHPIKNKEVESFTNDEGSRKNYAAPANLASILASASTLSYLQDHTTERQLQPASVVTQSQSKTENYIQSSKKNPSSNSKSAKDNDYYDDLYQEFIEMYYDYDDKDSQTTSTPGSFPVSTIHNFKASPTLIPPTSLIITSTSSSTLPITINTTTTGKTTLPRSPSPSPPTTAAATASTTFTRLSTQATIQQQSSTSTISLSEILQVMELSLPQFLISLKSHGTSLKEFTALLQSKKLNKGQLKSVSGNVGRLLEIVKTNSHISKMTTTPHTVKFSNKFVMPRLPRSSTVSTQTVSTTSIKTPKTSTVTSKSTTPITTASTRPSARPKIFGSSSGKLPFFNKAKNDSIVKNKNVQDKSPLSIKLDISGMMKDKGISASDILHDFKTMFNFSSDTFDIQTKAIDDNEKIHSTVTTTSQRPYNLPPSTSLKPYKASGGAEQYRPANYGGRFGGRGLVQNRLSSTTRPTLRPPYSYKPASFPPDYNPNTPTESTDSIKDLNPNLVNISKNDSNDYFGSRKRRKNKSDPYYPGSDPGALDISTRSAIMAAGILGGVALAVFVTIMVVVKYRSHVHRTRRRTPLPLSVSSSDTSSSSTPPIYSNRISMGGGSSYKTSGFWNTLKKRWDPYTLSTSPSTPPSSQ